jgi:hypothetical protein
VTHLPRASSGLGESAFTASLFDVSFTQHCRRPDALSLTDGISSALRYGRASTSSGHARLAGFADFVSQQTIIAGLGKALLPATLHAAPDRALHAAPVTVRSSTLSARSE